MSRTYTLPAAAAALGVLAGFVLAPGGAPPLDRDVAPHAVAVAWSTPGPPVQVVRIRDSDGSPGMPVVHWSTGPDADPAVHPHPHSTADQTDDGGPAEASTAIGAPEGADAAVRALSRACPERSRRASARLRQS